MLIVIAINFFNHNCNQIEKLIVVELINLTPWKFEFEILFV